jgi:hypothetical protein
MAWGAHEYVAGKNYLQFKVHGPKHSGHVKIELSPEDLYNISAYTVRGTKITERVRYDGVFVEDIVDILDDIVG